MSIDHPHILIVDDDDDLRHFMRVALREINAKVYEAENGRAGLEIIAEAKPDLIILDIMMPEMTGLEFCRIVIEDLGELDIPVILTSAISEKSKALRDFMAMQISRKSFLKKPFDAVQVVAEVKKLLGLSAPEAEPAAAKEQPQTPTPFTPAPKPGKAASAPPPPKPREESSPEIDNSSINRHRLKVLCVDDDPDILALLRLTLRPYHEVQTAENGMAALALIDDYEPDFVISDMDMPILNGLQTIEAIRAHPKFNDIPVFILTGEKATNLPKQIFEAGGNLMLRKPIDPARLVKVIARFVEEMDMRPQAPVAKRPARAAMTEQKKGGAPAMPRVLVITHEPGELAKLREILDVKAQGRVSTFYCEDPRNALGNLSRWEPDVVLINPRHRTLDGIAFTQSLRLKKMLDKMEVVFVGTEFYQADRDFSRKSFSRDVIDLNQPETSTLQTLAEAITKAIPKIGPKKYTLAELGQQDKDLQRKLTDQKVKLEMQRDHFRHAFHKVQEFIDSEGHKF